MNNKLPDISVCACGAKYPQAPKLTPRNHNGRSYQVQCHECGRCGPIRETPAVAVYSWNEDSHGIKNPRDDLVPHLDGWRPAYFPLQGKGER